MWDMCQMLSIWHISHTKHKHQLPSDVAYVPKLYHICPYRCKFATVQTDVVKPNNVLYLLLSLSSHFQSWLLISSLSLLTSDQSFPQQLNKHYLLLSLLSLPVLTLDFLSLSSHIRPKLPLTTQQRKNKMTLQSDPRRSKSSSWARPLQLDHRHRHCHSDRLITIVIAVGGVSGMGEATPIGSLPSSSLSEAQVAWARPLRSSTSSSPLRSLSLFFGGWLFWLLVVGLMVVGWSGCGCEIWVDICVWVWVDRVGWFWLIGFWL